MRAPALSVLCVVTLAATPLRAQSLDPRLHSGLVWRNVGPFRGGRISAAPGAIGQPGVFYVGTPNGGVWKTTSAGATWFPIFDSIRTGAQHALLLRLSGAVQSTWIDFKPVSALRAAVRKIAPDDTASELGKAARALAARLDSIAGDSLVDGRQVWDGPPPTWSFADLNGEFGLELTLQDNADQTPTRAALALARSSCDALTKLVGRWKQVVGVDLPAFNATLTRQGMPPLAVPSAAMQLCAA